MTKLIIQNFLRSCLVILLGTAVFGGASYFLLFSIEKAQATIYWQGGSATDIFFVPRIRTLGMKAVYGGPVTMNGNDGHYVVLTAEQDVPELLKELKQKFSELPEEDVIVGKGTNAGFFTVNAGDRTCAIMLIKDDNINKTWLFAVIMPKELFHRANQLFDNESGVDPVAELRPPASKRVFCFETPAIAFAAYKSIDGDLADFYESAFSTDDMRAVSVMAFAEERLPNNGNLFFFDSSNNKGFVVYQSDPKNNCSYAIVCAQMQ